MLDTLSLLLCIGAATVGGVFLAFSTFVMNALAQLPPSQGIAAMQRINVTVLNPLFLGTFMGTALLATAAAVLCCTPWSGPRSAWLLAAGLLYLVGSFLVTVACNVPRNDRLARLDAASPEASAYWSRYVRDWTRWNHVRTASSMASSVCAAIALRD